MNKASYYGSRWSYMFKDQPYRCASMITVVVHTLIIPVSMILLAIFASLPIFWPFLALYVLIIILDTRPERGVPLQWFQKWCRRWRWWKAFAYYYPVKLHKTVDLAPSDPPRLNNSLLSSISPWTLPDVPALFLLWPVLLIFQVARRILGKKETVLPPSNSRKYLFGVSPHGIISMGAFCALNTEGCGWSEVFPGIPVRLLTLASNFYFPFYRQYLLATGVASVSKQSCINLLNNNQNIAVVLGGARESLLAQPYKFDIILRERKGFIKVALQTGASLVPVISFGENDVYEQVQFAPNSWGNKIHNFMTTYVGFTIPLFHARGVLNHSSGVIAYRRPINVVVGKPIHVPLDLNPSQETIDDLHDTYIREFKQLYSNNVNKFSPGVELRIVD